MQLQQHYAKQVLVKISLVKLTNSFSSMNVESEARNISAYILKFSYSKTENNAFLVNIYKSPRNYCSLLIFSGADTSQIYPEEPLPPVKIVLKIQIANK